MPLQGALYDLQRLTQVVTCHRVSSSFARGHTKV
jgi:hypothetical protein